MVEDLTPCTIMSGINTSKKKSHSIAKVYILIGMFQNQSLKCMYICMKQNIVNALSLALTCLFDLVVYAMVSAECSN